MTVTEIAKKAGVSIGTVDRVIHKRGRVSEETAARIQQIIKEEGYQPNPLARHLKRHRDYKIGVLMPEVKKESGYWKLMYSSIQKAAEELAAFSFTIVLFEFIRPDRNSLVQAFEKMTSSDCCAYIIAPVMQEEMLVLLTGLSDKIPYCFIDSALPGSFPMCTVAQDPFRAGFLAGRLMQLTAPKLGRSDGSLSDRAVYAVMRPYADAFNLNERVRGFYARFTDEKDIAIVDAVCEHPGTQGIIDAVDRIISEYPDVRGICAVNSATHIAADRIHSKHNDKKPAVIGFDLVDENRQGLIDGKIDCIISQNPEEQGRQVFSQLYRYLVLEEKPESTIHMPFDIYFKENIV